MKDDLLYINHILDCILKIERYTQAGAAAFCGVDLPRIWSIVTTDLPVFKQQMELLQARYS